MTTVRPPNVSETHYLRALHEWASIIGEANVLTSADRLSDYADPFAPHPMAKPFAACAVVLPGSVDEIREVLRIARTYGVPLWPVSTGRNFAYGGGAPRLTGSAVLDLKRLNRILEVDETLAYALVEPGAVT